MSRSRKRKHQSATSAHEKNARALEAASRSPSPQKDPDQWVTGDESMTGPQASYLETLAREAGEGVDPNMTKAEASKRIEELQEETGRGIDH